MMLLRHITAIQQKAYQFSLNFLYILPPQQMMAATKRARSLSSSSRELKRVANWNLGSIMSLKGRRRLLRNSRVTNPPPRATSTPSLFMQEARSVKRASQTPYFSRVTCCQRVRWRCGVKVRDISLLTCSNSQMGESQQLRFSALLGNFLSKKTNQNKNKKVGGGNNCCGCK